MEKKDRDLMPVEIVWGNPILDEGFTNIPNLILLNYTRVGLSHAEWGLLTIMMSFKHGSDDIFPSQETLARIFYADKYHPDKSERALRKLISSIEDKGLIEAGYRYKNGKRTSNYYSFAPLIEACLKFTEKKDKPENGVVIKKKKKKKLQEPKVPVVQEPEVPVVQEPEVPVVQEPEVPTNKKKEKANKNKQIEKESIYQEQIKHIDLPIDVKRVLEKKIDRLILFDVDLLDVELNYKVSGLTPAEYANIVNTMLRVGIKTNFDSLVKASIATYIKNRSKKIVDDQPASKDSGFSKENDYYNTVFGDQEAAATKEEEENQKWLEDLLKEI
ncbi:hypothetical protein [Fictibacillus sp. NRS-1165]|uniref:hypothetical protein n=1 Tax=Fictibacillus sp. NRS-1165 TaxID=3144463 RepID=UPI003D1C55A5